MRVRDGHLSQTEHILEVEDGVDNTQCRQGLIQDAAKRGKMEWKVEESDEGEWSAASIE